MVLYYTQCTIHIKYLSVNQITLRLFVHNNQNNLMQYMKYAQTKEKREIIALNNLNKLCNIAKKI
jgi:hypothetical protein